MKVKIISQKEAISLGLSLDINNSIYIGRSAPIYIYGVAGKRDNKLLSGAIKKRHFDVVDEVFRINTLTGKHEIIKQTNEYKALKKKLKINEYKK
jgi:hypothetical protein